MLPLRRLYATTSSCRLIAQNLSTRNLSVGQGLMTPNTDFMERWAYRGDGEAGRRETRSTRTVTASGSAQKRKRDDEDSSASPLKNRKSDNADQLSSLSAISSASPNKSATEILTRLLSQVVFPQDAEQQTQPNTPFAELLGTLVISRPIKHTIGHRAIRTLLNPPYNLRTPRAILDAGEKRVFEALEEARTLHKDKTASQIVALAHTVISKFEFPAQDNADKGTNTGLEKLRKDARGNGKRLREILQKEVKGLGETGTTIFLRRIQTMWAEFWPFVDAKTAANLENLGLSGDAQELKALLEECWPKINNNGMVGEDEGARKRFAFLEILKAGVSVGFNGKNKKK